MEELKIGVAEEMTPPDPSPPPLNAELAQESEASKFVLAREGDTWESISTRASGGPDKAGAIRTLNGARYGEKPRPGELYLVQ